MVAYGITASIFSIIMGYIGKLTHSRILCMLLSSLLSYTIFVVMLEWHPNANQAYVLYILACISGLTTAIIKPFTTGLTSSENPVVVDIPKLFFMITIKKTLKVLFRSTIFEIDKIMIMFHD